MTASRPESARAPHLSAAPASARVLVVMPAFNEEDSIGATLARTLEAAGYRQVHSEWFECPMDQAGIENMLLYYDEIREKYHSLGIMTSEEIDEQQRLLAALGVDNLPAVWGMYCVTCVI